MVRADHDGKAAEAAETAALTSDLDDRATDPIAVDVVGEVTGRYALVVGGTKVPLM